MADEASQGLKSLDTALGVLDFLSRQDGAMTLSDIARGCGMPLSKTHRYLASFVLAGLVKQEGRSGRYDLGAAAMRIGLAALARHDFVNTAADGLSDLAAETGMTVLLAVWANEGATVVRWQKGVSPTVTSIGLGTTLPLLTSATGRIFLAYAPRPATQKARETELRRAVRNPTFLPDAVPSNKGLEALAASIRKAGYASVDGRFIPGLVAAAAPILDWQEEVQAAVTLVGVDPAAVRPDAAQVACLMRYCQKLSLASPVGTGRADAD
ncbi:IclR family transcriptional regulator [Mameliella alba]|uniref:IclR family transcriptional regulator n=1 Tax=Mameliella alba TaxID=561184 RepID=UPI000B52DA1E|nr:IclR family transcriptional regulator [Mameliella alba]MBY6122324.1 IclR family transcriptional regulator [Mameliella alba]OWV40792.1 transcriptional regulator [Mameliella alba]OWV52194.1 transcriptional regulator [Mameliella alba]